MLTSFQQQKKKAHLTIVLNETQESILQEYLERSILPFFEQCLEISLQHESIKNSLINLANCFFEGNFQIFSNHMLQACPKAAKPIDNLHKILFPQEEEEKALSPFGPPYRSIFDAKICDRSVLTASQMRGSVAESLRIKIKAFLNQNLLVQNTSDHTKCLRA